jgi:DNA-binding NarL/FixJ family response regulator
VQPRIFAIDSRPLVRSGLARLAQLALGGGAQPLGGVDQASAAIKPGERAPRAVLLGVRPGDDPEQLVREARALGAPVILVLESDAPRHARAALAAGADGYVMLAGVGADVLGEAVRAVELGERFVPSALDLHAERTDGSGAITPRCLEVLRSLSEGLYDHEIADKLAISTSAVRKHIKAARERLQARTRTQVVAIVARNGLV